MSGLDAFESTTLFFMLVVWWGNPFDTNGTSSKVMRKRYDKFKGRLKFIPARVVAPIWFLMYSLVAISLWLYLNYSTTEKHEDRHMFYDAIVGLMIANYFVSKLWTMLFFTLQNYWLGAIDGFLMFVSAAAIEILLWFHIHGNDQGKLYTSAILFIPYVLWTFYNSILSIDIAANNTSKSLLQSRRFTTLGRESEFSDEDPEEEMEEITSSVRPRKARGILKQNRGRSRIRPAERKTYQTRDTPQHPKARGAPRTAAARRRSRSRVPGW